MDDISPDWPPGSEEERYVENNCRVAPAELPGVMTVSSTGPVGYPGYDLWIADYSSVGMSRVDVGAPGGDYFRATGTVQDAVLAATSSTGDIYAGYDPLNAIYPGITVLDSNGGAVCILERHLDVFTACCWCGCPGQGKPPNLGSWRDQSRRSADSATS